MAFSWRHLKEILFKLSGLICLGSVLGVLLLVVGLTLFNGYSAFLSTQIHLTLEFQEPLKTPLDAGQIKAQLPLAVLKEITCPLQQSQEGREEASQILSRSAPEDVRKALEKPLQQGSAVRNLAIWVLASDEADGFYKSKTLNSPYDAGRLSPLQSETLKNLLRQGKLRLRFNSHFLTGSDSTLPEFAGIWGAFCGSLWTLLLALCIALPLGLGTALYLEEVARPTRMWCWIDVQLSNLASIPSVLFGLLTFLIFDHWLQLPRPSPLLGGLAIGMMMAPLLMMTNRIALQAVPASLRHAARALGASHTRIILDHVLPQALPQLIVGTLLTTVRALGETAPILMVGMVAFVDAPPASLTDAATTLPAQIFSWSKNPEFGFVTKTSGGILALFFLLCVLNGLVFLIRKKDPPRG